jgi:FkbM family methyltransferase
MKKIFIDGGTHLCEGLRKFIEIGVIDPNTEIHTFEPNPSCNVSERIKEFTENKITYHDCAIWVSDGIIKFQQENTELSMSGSPSDGQSVTDGWASSVENIGFVWNGYEKSIDVKSVDFSKFIERLDGNSHIICKLDIEGSEFVVLRHLISTGAIKKISELYVEFHEWTMITESIESRDKLIREISDSGVLVHPWYE